MEIYVKFLLFPYFIFFSDLQTILSAALISPVL